jgi:hypothetical protein
LAGKVAGDVAAEVGGLAAGSESGLELVPAAELAAGGHGTEGVTAGGAGGAGDGAAAFGGGQAVDERHAFAADLFEAGEGADLGFAAAGGFLDLLEFPWDDGLVQIWEFFSEDSELGRGESLKVEVAFLQLFPRLECSLVFVASSFAGGPSEDGYAAQEAADA